MQKIIVNNPSLVDISRKGELFLILAFQRNNIFILDTFPHFVVLLFIFIPAYYLIKFDDVQVLVLHEFCNLSWFLFLTDAFIQVKT